MQSKRISADQLEMIFTPYFRKGHVICRYSSDFHEKAPTMSFDLSFPALGGASGAPVVIEHDGSVTGMIVANVERIYYLLR
jgi:hypothetical protein